MKVKEKKMLEIMELMHVTKGELALLLGISISILCRALKGRMRFSIHGTKLLLNIFGADLLSHAIDWDAMNIRNPFSMVIG